MRKIAGISHRPFGIEHPYHQEADERFPRRPVAGDSVRLGAITTPAGAARQVWVEWCAAGDSPTEAEGQPAGESETGTIWNVNLPALTAGQRIRYTLYATDGEQILSSEPQEFDVPGWRRLELLHAGGAENALALTFSAGADRPTSTLLIGFAAENRLHLSLQYQNGKMDFQPAEITMLPDGRATLRGKNVVAEVSTAPYRLEVRRADGTILLSTAAEPEWLLFPGQTPLSARLSFDSPADEGFYGFGERYNSLNQRGNRPDVVVFEQNKQQGIKSYIPMPYFLSSRGYGFYLDSARRAWFDLAAADSAQWTVTAGCGPEGAVEMDLLAGASMLENLRAFTDLTGKPALPPAWIFGPWMSSNEWNSQAEVMKQVALTEQHDIPATVLVIEAWSDESTFYIWNDAQYTPKTGGEAFSYQDFTFPPDGLWPDPQGMIDALHRKGIRLMLWQIPTMKKLDGPHAQHDRDTAYFEEQGYHVRNGDGTPYRVRGFWFHDALLLDPTHPAARAWWMRKRAYLLDEMGVDGFKTDGGEHLWRDDALFHDGKRGDEMINLYPNLYVGMYHTFARQHRGGDAAMFSRAGFTGAQAFPCHWAGDEASNWQAFRDSIRAGLNAGLSGMPFWGWDIGGFSGELPSAELYLRAAAMAAFCPIMQYHSDFNHHRRPLRDRTPWNVAEQNNAPEVIAVYRELAKLRMRLLPYIEAEAQHSSQSGEPLMRPLFLDWPGDPTCWTIDDQYLFGRALLVAPVVQESSVTRRLYLPAGQWTDFWSGQPVRGGQWIETDAPLDRIPVYIRAGQPWPGLA